MLFTVAEHRRRKQLYGVGVVPFLERVGIEAYIVHYIGEPTGVKRPSPQVAHDLHFYMSDNHTPLNGQI